MTRIRAKNNKILATLAAIFLFIFALFTPIQAIAQAEDTATVQNMDTTKVDADLSDLSSARMAGITAKNSVQLVRFQEYCYSEEYPIYDGYYGLYLYVYTPDGDKKPLATEYNQNKVNMAIADIGTSAPDYENMPLKYLGSSEIYKNKLHKFKVLFTEEEKVAFLSEVKKYAKKNDGVRRYDVVSFQLTHKDGTKTDTSNLNATDSLTTNDRQFSQTLYFSGFGIGMSEATSGENATSTLTCKYDELETIELEIKHANYRTGDYSNYVCDELQTAYFSVPNNYFQNYGGLQKIEAEWYEYKTKPIFVTSDSKAYAALYDYIGRNIGDGNEDLPWRVLFEEKRYTVKDFYFDENGKIQYPLSPFTMFGKVYNLGMGNSSAKDGFLYDEIYRWDMWNNSFAESEMFWLFERANVKSADDYAVSVEEVIEYMMWYSNIFHPNDEKLKGKYAKSLFASKIDADRIKYLNDPSSARGYIKQTIDAENDTQDLMFQVDKSWWDEFWYGASYEEKNFDPIVVLDATDNIGAMNTTTFAEKYLIDPAYAQSCYNYCQQEIAKGNKAVLFRFAVTDYYASTARFDYAEEKDGDSDATVSEQDGYVAQMTTFLDFDVIHLGFRNAEELDTIIGVVSDPLDIINGLTPPPDAVVEKKEFNWLAFIAMILLLILLWPILSPVFKFVLEIVVTVISIPFKLIGSLFRRK